ncbi:MAG: HD domain-containing protein [Planctomycetaceae bacterium]|nr:HD domain-containing protein [Planctomycetaceae bacterium]
MPTATIPKIADDNARLLLPGEIRLSEVMSALSTALDLTEGQPPGHAARSCLIGMKIARQIGLSNEELTPLFYGLLLKDLGCSSNAAKMCWLFGADERIVKKDLKLVNWTRVTECLKFSLSHVSPHANPLQKALQMAIMARAGEKAARDLVETRCHRGADIARELRFPEATCEAISALDEHWNGKGHPYGLKGEEIPLLSRIMGLAQTIEVFHATFGREHALEVAVQRSGSWFDPQLITALQAVGDDQSFWINLETADFVTQVAACEPDDRIQTCNEEDLDRIAHAFASVVDAKSPWTFKHSEGVAKIAEGIAGVLGFSSEMQRDIRRAGLLHDIGKLGVANTILDKPGRPTDEEFAAIRMHPDFSKQILDRVDAFRRLSDVASAHHERLDGNGYHRQIPGEKMTLQARILAIADVFEALSAERPYRNALPLEKVHEIMSKDLDTGLCRECYEALQTWQDRTSITPRVEAQLDAIERLHREL